MDKKDEVKKLLTEDFAADCAIGALSGAGLTMLLFYFLAVLISGGQIRQSFGDELVISAAFIGAILSGGITAKRQGRMAVQMGIIGGMLFFLLLIVLGAISKGGFETGQTTFRLGLFSLLGGVLGGIILGQGKLGRKTKRSRQR